MSDSSTANQHRENSDESQLDYFRIYVPIFQASITGDWEAAMHIFERHSELVRVPITKNCETALHIAASSKETAGSRKFVRNLVSRMDVRDLELKNLDGNTALCLAATAGNIQMIKIMMDRNPSLLTIPGNEERLPLHMSALKGQHKTVKYLYDVSGGMTGTLWTDEKRGSVLIGCIECNFFDVALKIVKDHPQLSTSYKSLAVLAGNIPAFNRAELNILKRIKHFVKGGSAKEDTNEPLQLLKIIWTQTISRKTKDEVDQILKGPPQETPEKTILLYHFRTLFVAAKMGNTRFVIEMLRVYPDLMWQRNDDGHTIFHIAVMNRHRGIFSLLYELGSTKDMIIDLEDNGKNNMIHLVGMTSVKMRSQTSGPSLVMQREILWFKEVEKMLPHHMRENKNTDGQTPYEIFSEANKDLVTRGLDWMKDCMVVATLIVTIAFSVAFTVPGSYEQTHGLPTFIHKHTFLVFVIADAISLFSSSTSLLVFLSILTSHHNQRDFMYSLPNKLMTGLGTLFISVVTMMITFSTSFFVLYHNRLKWVPVLITAFAIITVFIFAYLQFHLLKDMFLSMYDSNYLFEPKKRVLYRRSSKRSDSYSFRQC